MKEVLGMNDKVNTIDGLVSIITPAYNAENYIYKTIQSVKNQTYKNWEMIIVDDHSSDNTVKKINKLKDSRIKIIELNENAGAANARNRGIEIARGEFMAFLDSDDLWTKDKLSSQIAFMKENNYSFTCTEYAEMDENNDVQAIIQVYDQMGYDGVLKYCPGNSTVMYNVKQLGKFYAPLIKRRNDFAMWLQVIKKAGIIYGLHETYSIYRVRSNSLSSNKAKLIKYQWKVFRKIENLPLSKSIYLLIHKIFMVLFKTNRISVQ